MDKVKSKLLVKKEHSFCGAWRCTGIPPKQNHGREQDATLLASSGLTPTNDEAPRYRSRSVETEVRHKGVEPIFSAILPLETLRVLLCVACQEDVFRVEDPFLISIADVSRAHFYADAVRDVYVRLPDEEPKSKAARRVWEIA